MIDHKTDKDRQITETGMCRYRSDVTGNIFGRTNMNNYLKPAKI